MKPATRYAIITAAGLLTASVLALTAAGAQTTPAIANGGPTGPRITPPDLDPAGCSNGNFVADPADNPGLVADCRTLVNIRNHWTRQTIPDTSALLTWGTGDTADITTWSSIYINDQRAEGLYLDFAGIRGAIPAELGNLTNLKALSLGYTELTGPIPAELGNLTNLTRLTLRYTELTGTIPAELGNLTNLERLDLFGNQLTGTIPAELGNLTNLTKLHLFGNQLTGTIPAELGNLTNLETLNLSDNQLTGSIPAELGNLTNLTDLNLAGNGLTGSIPAELGNLTNLRILNLAGNGLTGSIPAELGNRTNLRQLYLYLDGNQLCPATFDGRFCDDDDSSHETNIETIAGWEITIGCGAPNYYCPADTITRRQMAAFLHRAVTHRTGTEPTATDPPAINDLTAPSALPYAQWAVAAGVMQAPQGQFNPKGIVTRADMAAMMAAAFDHITAPAAAQGVFADMTGQPEAVTRAAEALRTAGVTTGCSTSPLRYCPDQTVTRAQMASFFARALR